MFVSLLTLYFCLDYQSTSIIEKGVPPLSADSQNMPLEITETKIPEELMSGLSSSDPNVRE